MSVRYPHKLCRKNSANFSDELMEEVGVGKPGTSLKKDKIKLQVLTPEIQRAVGYLMYSFFQSCRKWISGRWSAPSTLKTAEIMRFDGWRCHSWKLSRLGSCGLLRSVWPACLLINWSTSVFLLWLTRLALRLPSSPSSASWGGENMGAVKH